MSTFTQFCGIDVSKGTLDYYLARPNGTPGFEQEQVANELGSIAEKFQGSRFDDTLFILEYTGTYSSKVVHQLVNMTRSVSVVSPVKSKHYMAAQGITNKHDKQAARSLALMGQQVELRLYKAPSEDMQQRKHTLVAMRALEKQQQMLRNQLHALDQLPLDVQQPRTALATVLQAVESQLKPLRESLCQISKTPAFDKKKKLAASVVGIGDKTAEAILLVTNGLEDFEDCDKVSKFLGITPATHHSGTSVRKNGGITKFGSGEVRGLLYMCTRSAVRYNQPCKELYQRLRKRGKPHKLAAVAVMHKLVKQVFACVKSETLFDKQYHLKKNKPA